MIGHRTLRVTVPTVLFIVGVLAIVAYAIAEYHSVNQRLHDDAYQELRTLAALSTGDIELAYRSGDYKEARAAIERLGGLPNLTKAALVSAGGIIIYAARPNLEGEPLSTYLQRINPPTLDDAMVKNEFHLVSREEGLRQTGFFPVLIQGESHRVVPTQFGWLVLQSDLTGVAAQRFHELQLRVMPYLIVLTLICVAMWWMFRRLLLQRIEQLSTVTRRIAMGDFSAVPDIGGKDELADLSKELARMSRRLREHTNELAFVAGHDGLTSLLNRRGFDQQLEAAVTQVKLTQTQMLLVYLDLDSFHVINDTQGHSAGDALIVHISEVLQAHLGDAAVLARTGGDEFAAILPLLPGSDPNVQAEEFWHAAAAVPFIWQGQRHPVQASVGATLIDGSSTAEELMSQVDTACNAAKERGRNRVQFWHPDEEELLRHYGQMKWVGQLQAALEHDRFVLYAQEIQALQKLEGGLYFEVLIRVRDEQGVLRSPSEFLPAAERFHLSAEIDQWVIRKTYELLAASGDTVQGIRTCSINLSGPSLCDDAVMATIRQALVRHPQILARQVCFEITETAAITNLAKAVRFIEELRGLDFRIALDDFGSGVSSFGYLKNLPVDIIKIDGFFVRDMLNSPLDRVITRSINAIAHEMGKLTIAEFAETAEIIQTLQRFGVDYAQGYGIGKPVPLDKLLRTYAYEAHQTGTAAL